MGEEYPLEYLRKMVVMRLVEHVLTYQVIIMQVSLNSMANADRHSAPDSCRRRNIGKLQCNDTFCRISCICCASIERTHELILPSPFE